QTETEATGAPQKHHYTLNQQVGSITLSPKQLGLDIGLEYFKYLEDQFCAAAFNFLRNADMTQNDVKDTESAYRGWLEIDEEDLE
ncbi:hypothetical protein, partial [Klebsiella pneumoniae]|uniref:hypothetical protein n=1 Tax=Klebsiella pneumoniae TaxID=573 RepID=UPI002163EE96